MKRQPRLVAGPMCNQSLTPVWKKGNYGTGEQLSLNPTGAVSFYSILIANVTRMLLTCHVMRKSGVSNFSDEEANDLQTISTGHDVLACR